MTLIFSTNFVYFIGVILDKILTKCKTLIKITPHILYNICLKYMGNLRQFTTQTQDFYAQINHKICIYYDLIVIITLK